MNGLLKNWPIIVGALALATGWGTIKAEVSAQSDKLKTHAERFAHEEAQKAMTGYKASNERIDERTSIMLRQMREQREDTRRNLKLLQRILENQIR